MEPLPPPQLQPPKPGKPLDVSESAEDSPARNLIVMTETSMNASNASLSLSSPTASQGLSYPPTPRNNLNIIASPVDSSSPSATPSPFLHPLQTHTFRETNKALKRQADGRKVINNYLVIKELGRGVHGKVKRALNLETQEEVAIKIIPRFSKKRRLGKITAHPEKDRKTMREIAILKKIQHPHVVSLLEVIDDPELKKIYMVLEYVELGEICWRKKGLPHIAAYERRRIEQGMESSSFTDEDLHHNQLRLKEHLGDLQKIQQEEDRAVMLNQAVTNWHYDHHLVEDDSSASMSRNVSTHNFGLLDHGLASSVPSSVIASRATSRAPSRAPSRTHSRATSQAPSRNLSISSLTGHFAGIHGGSINEEAEQDANETLDVDNVQRGRSAEEEPLRGRASSLSESVISHSSLDYNSLVTHDAFADDFSYVPCFTLDLARSTFRDTVLGLEHLHYQGVVHRDIKPANLLMTKGHRVKISDFGVSYFGRPAREGDDDGLASESEAEDFDDDRELAKTVGTPAFFAPELCYTDLETDQFKVSEQIDIWSLGVTLYCLIYARIPFLAEDEYQMFKKIATEDVFIPTQRLAPVDPSTSPKTTSLYERQNSASYRGDNELVYEEVDPLLRDLLQKMLVKDPERRIRIHDIKRHPWVLADIPDIHQWLDDTDPAKPSLGHKIQVDEKELNHAVVPLTLHDKLRSAFKNVKKVVSKVMHPLGGGERDSGKSLRRRAPSSTASSCGDIARGPGFGSNTSIQSSLLPWDTRRKSTRPDECPHPLVNSMTVNSSSAPQMVYDPLATVLPEVSTPHHPGAPAMFQEHVREKSLEEPYHRMSDLRHSASLRSHRKSHSRLKSTPLFDRVPSSASTDHPLHRPVFDSGDDLVLVQPSAQLLEQTLPSGSRTRGATHSHIPSISTACDPPSPGTIIATATAPSSPHHGRHSRSLRSVDLGRSHYTTAMSPRGLNNFLCLTPLESSFPESHSSAPQPKVQSKAEERPVTAHRVRSITETAENHLYTIPDTLPTQSLESQISAGSSSAGTRRTRTRASTGLSSTQSIASSICEAIGTPMSSPSELASPISSTNLARESQCSKTNVSAYQSDPSLPALLSGASSVSADMDGDMLSALDSLDATSHIYQTTDSTTPTAMAKNRMDGFLHLERSENIIPVQLDVATRPPHSPISVNQHQQSPLLPSRSLKKMPEEDDDADDSDSDEGLTLTMRRRSRMSDSYGGHGSRFLPRRRDTNASICSSDTAKKVDYL
ncbi:hypothetical protein BROUX41_005376 [Berkeleyomyces rouxiae]